VGEKEDFYRCFEALTGYAPFPWQYALYRRFVANDIPAGCDIPTGLGKTSVLSVWLLALAYHAKAGSTGFPRRLAYVVNRRTVVDQATREAEALLKRIEEPTLAEFWANLGSLRVQDGRKLQHLQAPLAISTLRGQFADNGTWRADPSRPAIVVGTVDMIGSRLLFNGYGAGFKTKPLHAAFLGQDTLIVHDEAHLEPAFQELLLGIEHEQQSANSTPSDGFGRLRVLALTATSRHELATRPASTFRLGDDDKAHDVVRQRLFAKKALTFHSSEATKVAERVIELALACEGSGRSVLIFLRKLEDVQKVVQRLPKGASAMLTGTIRGLERERLNRDPVFARFDPKSVLDREQARTGTVYLVCTSAGEVGVDISSDDMIGDLTPFDSMAQRLGRVNRYGSGNARIDIVHEPMREDASKVAADAGAGNSFEDEEQENMHPFEEARQRTFALLQMLPRVDGEIDASPAALQDLPEQQRRAAFTPSPAIRPVTDVLLDAWALTSILEPLPGRPPVADWLHGVAEWEPPETRVAWRLEVETERASTSRTLQGLLELYPLKPHELLRDTSRRVFKELSQIAKREPDAPVWVIDEQGKISSTTVTEISEAKEERIWGATVLLPPSAGGLNDGGGLDGSEASRDGGHYDVADQWLDDNDNLRRVRIDVLGEETTEQQQKHRGMRLVLALARPGREIGEEGALAMSWRWYVEPTAAEDQGSRRAPYTQTLRFHLSSAEHFAREIATALRLPEPEASGVVSAAKLHDLGKERLLWQRSIGNFVPGRILAKSGSARAMTTLTRYRHELGSIFDAEGEPELQNLTDESKDIARHLIAAHHGRARPCFLDGELFDPNYSDAACQTLASEVARRFGRLQRHYGRWGLAYLESLLRAADVLASLDVESTEALEPVEAAQ